MGDKFICADCGYKPILPPVHNYCNVEEYTGVVTLRLKSYGWSLVGGGLDSSRWLCPYCVWVQQRPTCREEGHKEARPCVYFSERDSTCHYNALPANVPVGHWCSRHSNFQAWLDKKPEEVL